MIKKNIWKIIKDSSSLFTRLVIILLVPGLMTFSPPNLYPTQKSGASSLTSKSKVIKKKKRKSRRRSRRSYNPIATRAKALEILRRNSETLCELAGLQPILDGSSYTFNDAEETEEIEEMFDEILRISIDCQWTCL